jgi:hypothetical protein
MPRVSTPSACATCASLAVACSRLKRIACTKADAAAGAVVHADNAADGVRVGMRNAQARAERDAGQRRGHQHALRASTDHAVGHHARQVLGDQPDRLQAAGRGDRVGAGVTTPSMACVSASMPVPMVTALGSPVTRVGSRIATSGMSVHVGEEELAVQLAVGDHRAQRHLAAGAVRGGDRDVRQLLVDSRSRPMFSIAEPPLVNATTVSLAASIELPPPRLMTLSAPTSRQ